ncbi:MAG: BREX-1 system adenine-specific DNA-methyltransferase PglX [Actinomyces bouchesdurhonensis]|uniref:site-specific DNA-methyltransferase (adenine-specific) n=1 Tax=Actinomyces bouchesdurhonensis TaxID=1852361 RepID=A0A929WTU2_9ACTO|nr:BREX-1 system adenine-specific DNA-methyltransferase PglX [Actinomyces bouchesdurhonensis]
MNTSALESLASASRERLIEMAVAAIERKMADPLLSDADRSRLTQAVDKHAEAGGIRVLGAAKVVAYSWFNRLTALRYMDAMGISGDYGVVTPAEGSGTGVPECVQRARGGDFDRHVGEDARARAAQLLFDNRDLDAYVLLLREYFASWHRVMPGMFPEADDWTNLVPPADLLSAGESVRADIVAAIGPNESGRMDVEVIGWLYQFYIAARKQEINESKAKIDKDTLAPVTQLFTPHWVVRYLVENTLGKQWLRAHPDSALREKFEYLVTPAEGQEDQGLAIANPEDFRVIDPACGSGHMLTYAFDVLWEMYAEAGYPTRQIARLILEKNLHGADVDGRAAQLASFALTMKAVEHNPGFLGRLERESQRDGEISWRGPRIVHVESVHLDELSPAEIADASGDGVSLGISLLIEQLRYADTYGSLIRVPEGASTLFREVARRIEAGERPQVLGGADSEEWLRAADMCEILEDGRYTTLIANPPYLGMRKAKDPLKRYAKKFYKRGAPDLCTMFIERAASLAQLRGAIGMITMHAWMFLDSYRELRPWMLSTMSIDSMAHLGTRAFDSIGGEVVQTTAFAITNATSDVDRVGIYLRLVDGRNEAEKDVVLRTVACEQKHDIRFEVSPATFAVIPGRPIVYWASRQMLNAFEVGVPLGEVAPVRQGLATGDNERFLRQWFEVSGDRSYMQARDREDARASGARWFPHNKGGEFRKWWGNQDYVVNWEDDGREIQSLVDPKTGKQRSRPQNTDCYFRPCVSWSRVSSGELSVRFFRQGSTPNDVGPVIVAERDKLLKIASMSNSAIATGFLAVMAPGTHFEVGQVKNLPWIEPESFDSAGVERLIDIFRSDWDSRETSWDFARPPYLRGGYSLLQDAFDDWYRRSCETAEEAQRLETENNHYWADVYSLADEVEVDVPLSRVSLTYNPRFAFASTKGAPERSEEEYRWLHYQCSARELISWAIGVTMGRYSVDVPGLVLADQASSLDDFRARVAESRLEPDDDGIIPVTGGAFDDDASRRVKAVLRVVFGASDLGDNIEFLTRCLAVKSGSATAEFAPPVIPADPGQALEDYMAKSFAADHQKDYSGRPVYWSLESPKGTFRALIYLHRYTPDTVGQVLTKYAAPFVDRLKAESEAVGRERDAVMGDDRKADRERARIDKRRAEIDAQVAEVQGFIDSVLQPLAQRRIHLDLDDGVRINRLKLAYGWRSDLKDLPQPAIGAATTEVKKGITTDLKWARREIKKNNVWWS